MTALPVYPSIARAGAATLRPGGADATDRTPDGESPAAARPSPLGLDRLSPRERAVMDLLVRGQTAPQVAIALGIGAQTVKNHRAAIYRKLGLAGGPGRPMPRIALALLSGEADRARARNGGYATGYRHGYVDGLERGRREGRAAAPREDLARR